MPALQGCLQSGSALQRPWQDVTPWRADPTPCGWKRQLATQSRMSRPRARAARNLLSGTGSQAPRIRENSKSPGGRPLPLPTERMASRFKTDHSSSRRAVLFSHLSFLIHLFIFFGSFGFNKIEKKARRLPVCLLPNPSPRGAARPPPTPHRSSPLVTGEPRPTRHRHPESTD